VRVLDEFFLELSKKKLEEKEDWKHAAVCEKVFE
jgi:hypothetical protein